VGDSDVPRETYLTFARRTAAVSVVMWVLALLFGVTAR